MRFIYHHRTAGRGGEGVHITSVVNALRAVGHDVVVFSPPGVDPMKSADAVPLDKGNAKASGISRLWKWISRSCPQPVFEFLELCYNVYAVVRLTPVLRGPDPVAFYERYAAYLVGGVWVAKMCGRPVILEVNDVAGAPGARAQKFVGFARWVERRVFALADEIVTVSTYLQREILSRGGRPGHVHVIPNAIDPARFDRPDRRQELRAQLGLTDASVIGFVGWFENWDRLDRLVELLGRLQGSHPEVRLLLVGDGPAAAEIPVALEAKGLTGRAIMTGPVRKAEVPDYIGAMDMCVLPDSNEFGSPIVLFEFMAMGKPVIGPDVQPVRDVLEPGVTGFIVSRTDERELTQAAETLLRNPALARQMGDAGRALVFERHTWAAVARTVESLAAAYLVDEKRPLDAAGARA